MSAHILHTPMEETYRRIHGQRRWCFTCREKQWFEYVVQTPICVTGDETGCWYGPTRSIECVVCHTTDGDCFPGTQREWADD